MELRVVNEWDDLDTVIVGTAASMGGTPTVAESYDPKSKEHILAGTFPTEADCQRELDGLASLLESHGVRVLRPNTLRTSTNFLPETSALWWKTDWWPRA